MVQIVIGSSAGSLKGPDKPKTTAGRRTGGMIPGKAMVVRRVPHSTIEILATNRV